MAWVVSGSLAIGAAGCGGSVTLESSGHGGEAGATSSGGTAGNSSGGAAGDGGTAGSGGVGGSGGVAGGGGVGGFGNVGILRTSDIDFALAQFTSYEGPGCAVTVEEMGNCTLFAETASCGQAEHDGGFVTIEGPFTTSVLTMQENSVSGFPLFLPGQPVNMFSTGAEVPSFSGSVVAPEGVIVTSPSFASALEVQAAAGLPLTWNPIQGDVVVFVTDAGAQGQRTVSCVFDGGAGTGSLSAAVLAKYGYPSGLLLVYSVGSATVAAGSWPVYLFVEIEATDAEGFPAQVDVSLL